MARTDRTGRAYDDAARAERRDYRSVRGWSEQVRSIWNEWLSFAYGATAALLLVVFAWMLTAK